ncbi:MAG: winged helix-turn-helix transcriptional regulator [Phycisphaeraceae bacterium]
MIINPRVLRIAGPVPAVVHAFISVSDSGHGIELAYSQIADAVNISVSSARRAIEKLRQEGIVASEPAVEELYGQRGNRYTLLDPARPPVQYEQPYLSIDNFNCKSTETTKSINYEIKSIDYETNTGIQGNRERGALGGEIPWPTSWGLVQAWTPINSPMPFPANNNLLKWCKERLWLVAYMEGYVLVRQNEERRLRGWKVVDELSEKRRLQFLRDAEKLLRENPLPCVVEVIDWVFIKHGGWLPFDVIDYLGMTRKDSERKVTSLRKIWENFDMILGARSIEAL